MWHPHFFSSTVNFMQKNIQQLYKYEPINTGSELRFSAQA